MQNKQRYCGQLQNHVRIENFRGCEQRNYHARKIFVFLRGLTVWKVMPRSVWNEIVSWQIGRLNNSTKYLLHALMTTTSQRKKWNLLENCHMYAPKLSWNAYTWHVLDDLIFYGQWTNLHDQLQSGPKPVTNAWIDWDLTFIIRVITNNIVMLEILPNNADWDRFKTPILREILRTQNLLRVEHCAFLEVIHLFPISWMCKKQTSVSHSSTESEIISLDAGLRIIGIPALDLWDLIVTVLHGNANQRKQVEVNLSTSPTWKKISRKWSE